MHPIRIAGYLFYPGTSKCYSPYRQGPCPIYHMLTLPTGSYIPECVRNPCSRRGDGYVNFRSACHKLDTSGPCQSPELAFVVAVNTTNLQLDCLKLGDPVEVMILSDRFGGDDEPVVPNCSVGSQRWQEQKCVA